MRSGRCSDAAREVVLEERKSGDSGYRQLSPAATGANPKPATISSISKASYGAAVGNACLRFRVHPRARVGWLDESAAAALMIEGERLGVLGLLHPALEEEFKLKQPVLCAEIDFQGLYRTCSPQCASSAGPLSVG